MRQIGSRTYGRVIAAALMVTTLTMPAVAQTQQEREDPGNAIRSVLPEFLVHGRDASWIGVAVADASPGGDGATVTGVSDESPAARAGLREEDVIVRFDGERIRSSRHLARVVRETPIGREVSLDVLRDGEPTTLTLTTVEQPAARRQWFTLVRPDGGSNLELDLRLGDLAERLDRLELPRFVGDGDILLRLETEPGRLGARLLAINGQLAGYFGVEQGLLVQHVEPSTPAAEADLRAGDVITAVDGVVFERPAQLRRHLRETEPGGAVTLDIVRNREPMSIRVTLPDDGR